MVLSVDDGSLPPEEGPGADNPLLTASNVSEIGVAELERNKQD